MTTSTTGVLAEAPPTAFEPSQAESLPRPPRTPSWDVGPERRIDDGRTLARLLGWASIGLGAMEVFASDGMARFLGVEDRSGLIRLYGMREIAQGAAVLGASDPTPGIHARIAGDALDLATLGAAFGDERANRGALAAACATVAAITALDVLCAAQLSSRGGGPTAVS